MSDEEAYSPALGSGARPDTPLSALLREDLSGYSVIELTERMAALEDEIVRTRSLRDRKQSGRSAADALFSFKGN